MEGRGSSNPISTTILKNERVYVCIPYPALFPEGMKPGRECQRRNNRDLLHPQRDRQESKEEGRK